MRGALVALALGLTLLGAFPSPSPAASSTPAFSYPPLRLEVATRLENDFLGVLGPTDRKRQKALLKCLALLDRPAASGMKDLKAFIAVARLLEKAYPAEVGGGLGSEFSYTLLYGLQFASGEFSQMYSDLFQAVGKMAPSPQYLKAFGYLDAAQETLDLALADGHISLYGKATLKAWKLVLKGTPIAAAGALLPAPSAAFTVDGLALSTGEANWVHHTVSQRIVLNVFATNPATGDLHNLSIDIDAASTGVASTVLGGYYNLNTAAVGDVYFPFNAGTTTVTALDLAAHQFEGSFDLVTESGHAVTGTFSATWNLYVIED